MSHETDRVSVPTNGRRPHPAPAPDAPVADTADAHDDTDAERTDVASTPGYGLAVTPAQLAVGFGIVASLILLIVGRRRRGPKA